MHSRKQKIFELMKEEDLNVTSAISTIPVSTSTDWSKCLVCQVDTREKLVCPKVFADRTNSSGYTKLATDLQNFQDLGLLPNYLSLSRLDGGAGVEATFHKQSAKEGV